MDNQLAYIDQAAFLAMRANGHEPVQQLAWVYDHDINVERLREVHANLGFGLLGRRIERSRLPFGRHRWVKATHQGDLQISPARPRDQFGAWLDEQGMVRVDPEYGPSWRMAMVPFTEGGGAVTLMVSHSVADVGAILLSLFAALGGVKSDLGYPSPGARMKRGALREDVRAFRQSVPDIRAAFKAALPVLRDDKPATPRSKMPARVNETTTAIRPTVFAIVDAAEWDARAKELGGNSGSLVAGFAVRLGLIAGQMRDDGTIMLNFPVSDRKENDTRANALTGMSVIGNPAEVVTNLAPIRADLKSGLKDVAANPNPLLASLALAPVTPKRVARRLEWLVLGEGPVVGCSNMGDVPDVLAQIDGTQAEFVLARGVEWPIGPAELDRIGNWLFVGSGRLNGKLLLFVTAWQAGSNNAHEHFTELVKQALADFNLSGTFL
ncbi:MAG: hypothetical protein KIH64_017525 [Mycobacterium sp.]|nr:hypothetical protein [Mycobacterium sp.]